VTGRRYLERGRPVTVLVAWRRGRGDQRLDWKLRCWRTSTSGPRNVLIEREDGSRVVRPFRGLRVMPDDAPEQASLWGAS
jgi:acetyl esterase